MKKGEVSTLNKLILATIVFFILLVVTFMMTAPIYSGIDREDCRISVQAAANTKVLGGQSQVVPVLKCNTQFLDISDKVIKQNGKVLTSLKEGGEEKIKKTVANQMYDCWYQMGEGKIDPWANWGINTNHCVVCSEINFDRDAIQKYGHIEKFDEYLCNELVPGKDYTYCQYLFGQNKPNDANKGASIETEDQHTIIYFYADKNMLGSKETLTSGCINGLTSPILLPPSLLPFKCVVGSAVNRITQPKEEGQGLVALLKTKDLKEGTCDKLY